MKAYAVVHDKFTVPDHRDQKKSVEFRKQENLLFKQGKFFNAFEGF